jgi:hypothetical protein
MDLPTQTIIDVLTFLLPGFVTAQLLYSLTPAPRPVPFERTVQALIFTVVIQAAVTTAQVSVLGIGVRVGSIGVWSDQTRIAWSLGIAALLGIVFAWFDNTDRLHTVLRKMGITHQTSLSSEWYGALSQAHGYIVLHLVGQRRLYGWPEEWPNAPDRGHFVIAEGEWLIGEDRLPLKGVQRILIRAQDVEMVELMQVQEAVGSSTALTENRSGRS